jgi:hypothetical protein
VSELTEIDAFVRLRISVIVLDDVRVLEAVVPSLTQNLRSSAAK